MSSFLGVSKKWSHHLAKSRFSIFGIPRAVIMTIIGRLKTNKLARQNFFLWKPFEWLFLSWFFLASHFFLWVFTKFSSLFLGITFHYTLGTLHALFSLNMLLRSVIFENFWLFPQGGVIAVFTYSTSLPLPLPFPFQPHPSIFPDTPSPSLFKHEVMF